MEPGESVEQAAVRQTFEETGLRVRTEQDLGVVVVPAREDLVYEVHDIAARFLGGTLRAGDDADDVRWVPPEELPGLEATDGLLEHVLRFGVLSG